MSGNIVVDASVIIKWIAKEETSGKALTIRDVHIQGMSTIHVPTLLFHEITNTLANNIGLPLNDIIQFYKVLENLRIIEERFQFSRDFEKIAQTCQTYHISGYDATYVYLAQKLGTQLITADRKLFAKTKKLGYIKLL